VRIERVIIALRARASDYRAALLLTAGAAFVVLAFFSIRGYARLHLHPDLALLVAAFALTVPAIALNGAEFTLAARVAGLRVSGRQALTVSLASSAANLLPLPGAALVRSTVMVSEGATLGAAAGALAAVGVVWVGVTAAAVGVFAAGRNATIAAALLVAGALAITAGLLTASRRLVRARQPASVALGIASVEIAVVTSDTIRIWLVLRALGIHASAVQSFAMTAANVLATVIGVLPGGLGLREALSAVFGAASGLPAGAAVTASAADRVGVLAVLVIASASVALLRRYRAAADHPLTEAVDRLG
jgi:hypothetical protein